MILTDNTAHAHFEGRIDGELAAFISYRAQNGVVTLVDTEVEPAWEGKGVGSALARAALDELRERGLKVRPLCPFVAGFIGRHPEYEDLVAA